MHCPRGIREQDVAALTIPVESLAPAVISLGILLDLLYNVEEFQRAAVLCHF